jgi:nucleotide-binding universal stress UspA family protein
MEINTSVNGVTVNHHHLSGIPTDEILEFVESTKPQMLVLGTHGRSGLARLFGSSATKILRFAKCPVLVLRQHSNNSEHAPLKQELVP